MMRKPYIILCLYHKYHIVSLLLSSGHRSHKDNDGYCICRTKTHPFRLTSTASYAPLNLAACPQLKKPFAGGGVKGLWAVPVQSRTTKSAKGDAIMSDKTIIKLENLVFNYDGEPVLDGINLSIHDKEFVTFLGPSGCGKPPLFGLLRFYLSAQWQCLL